MHMIVHESYITILKTSVCMKSMQSNYKKSSRVWREFSAPHASPLKHHSEGEGVSDPDSDVDSPDPSTNVHHGMFMLDMSPIDKREEEMVSNFVSMSCGCKLGSNNDACSNQFSKHNFSFYCNNCSEMSRHELDLIILRTISCSSSPPGDSSCSVKTKYTIYNYIFTKVSVFA